MNREVDGTTHTGVEGVRGAGVHPLQEAQMPVLRGNLSGRGPLLHTEVTVSTLGSLSF